jgi:hypothetical protein
MKSQETDTGSWTSSTYSWFQIIVVSPKTYFFSVRKRRGEEKIQDSPYLFGDGGNTLVGVCKPVKNGCEKDGS